MQVGPPRVVFRALAVPGRLAGSRASWLRQMGEGAGNVWAGLHHTLAHSGAWKAATTVRAARQDRPAGASLVTLRLGAGGPVLWGALIVAMLGCEDGRAPGVMLHGGRPSAFRSSACNAPAQASMNTALRTGPSGPRLRLGAQCGCSRVGRTLGSGAPRPCLSCWSCWAPHRSGACSAGPVGTC